VVVSALTIRFKRPLTLLIMVVVCALFILFKGLTDMLVEAAYEICETFGLSTRVFDKLLSGDFTVSVARDNIKNVIRYYLHAYPIQGLGIYGDCFVTKGQYAHNLFLEIYSHFGYLMGTIITLGMTVVVYRGTRIALKSGNDNARVITLLLLCCCFKLIVSSSYLREPFLWLMIGYFAGTIRDNSKEIVSRSGYLRNSKFIK
jgi:hypothetical protein